MMTTRAMALFAGYAMAKTEVDETLAVAMHELVGSAVEDLAPMLVETAVEELDEETLGKLIEAAAVASEGGGQRR